MKTEDRVIELEIKTSYQEELLDSLNKTVAMQQQQIQKLEETCKLLHEKIKSVREDGQLKEQNEQPPHY